MSSTMRCPRCGAYWAGVEGLAAAGVACFDCLSRPAPRLSWRLNRRSLGAAGAVAIAVGVAVWALLPPRRPLASAAPSAAPPVVDTTVAVVPIVEPFAPPEPGPIHDHPRLQAPELRRDTTEVAPLPDEPRPQPVGITLRPEPEKPKEAPAVIARPAPRREAPAEAQLLEELAAVPEVGLGTTGPAVLASYVSTLQDSTRQLGAASMADPTPLARVRPDLRGLPLRTGGACRLTATEAVNLNLLSRELRMYLNTTASPDGSPRPETVVDLLRQALASEKRGDRPLWLRPDAVPTLLQMLMAEEPAVRKLLVELLAAIDHPSSTTALARRAVFDLDASVRAAAVAALRRRPATAYRPELLKALRYPWPIAADNAAEALAGLGDKNAVPHLVALLRRPDPSAPEELSNGVHVIREVVRVDHLANCLMCHPPSWGKEQQGFVFGIDPAFSLTGAPSKSNIAGIPNGFFGPGIHNYARRSLTLGGNGSSTPLIVRGDITFLRQDFSSRITPPKGLNAVPAKRFDFLVRTRTLSPAEARGLTEARKGRTTYPQREAVLTALRALTGKDAGPATAAWQALYPRADVGVATDRLRKLFNEARDDGERNLAFARWREQTSDLTTEALADFIAELDDRWQAKARDELVGRLARLNSDALRKWLAHAGTELRRAAVVATGRFRGTALVPDLIALLDGAHPADEALIGEALRKLTGEKHDSAAEWQVWWENKAME